MYLNVLDISRKSPSLARSGGRLWLERDGVAELLQAADVVALEPRGVELVEVVGAELGVRTLVAQHVIDDDAHAAGDGDDGLVLAPAASDAVVLGVQVGTLRPGDAPGHLAEHPA